MVVVCGMDGGVCLCEFMKLDFYVCNYVNWWYYFKVKILL